MSRFGYRNQREGQRGALLVLFALLLPVFFACAGLAVDLGNMYSYKSNLQNAVDAAALAGASGYTAGGDTVDYHPEADEMAAEYLKANLDNSYSSLKDKSFEAQTVSGKTYYRVKVTEPSPTYFMRILGIKPYIDVSADAVALVGNPGTTDLHFKDLIGAREILGLDSLKNGRVNTTYDGNVVDLSSRFAGTTIYTSSALGQKENQANADGNYSAVQAGEASDYNSFYRSTTEKINEMYDAAGSSVVDWNYTNRAVSGSSDYYKKETSGNANFKSNLDVIASGYSLLPTSRMSTLSPGFAKPETPVMSLIVKETALIPLGIIPAKPLAVWLLILRVVTTSPLRIATDDVFPTTPFISLIAAAGTASEGTLDTLTISLVISVYGGIS